MNNVLKTVGNTVGSTGSRLASTVRRPRKNAMQRAASWVGGHIPMRRRGPSKAQVAGRGLAAAALTLPLGLWAGRRMRRGGGEEAR